MTTETIDPEIAAHPDEIPQDGGAESDPPAEGAEQAEAEASPPEPGTPRRRTDLKGVRVILADGREYLLHHLTTSGVNDPAPGRKPSWR